MKRKPRIYYSDSQKALMWERWRQGDSLQKIAQLFDRNHSSVERILVRLDDKYKREGKVHRQVSANAPKRVRGDPEWDGRASEYGDSQFLRWDG